MDGHMINRRTFLGLALASSLALVAAACDDGIDGPVDSPLDDSSDDTTEVESPDTDGADDIVIDDDATDATADDDAVTDVDDTATDDAADTDATDDAVADDTDDAVATDDTDDAVATDDDATETEALDDADEILDRAADRFAELETAQFELDGTGYLELDEIGEISLSDAEGQIERPDRAEIDIKIDSAIADVPVTIVSYDGEVYIKDPVAGSTHSAPDDFQFNPAIMFDQDEGIPALIRSVDNAELIDESDDVEGRAAYQIYGVIDGDMVQQATAGTFPGTGDIDFNVWIDRETYDVLKIVADDPTEESDSTWEMWIYDHDEPVEIDDPS
ncbi:MAG: LppX_LprAFG lipoprotein [Sphaerobacteraceae bacterium]|nr:MAG: LppX_LprAFG lipoprotein [Sphaerobacteraceae bacterium]